MGAAAQSLSGGQDLTNRITNPNFTTNNAGWMGDPVVGGLEANRCAEKYNTTFNVYQDITDLPNGIYTISVQGFYRPGYSGTSSTARNAYFYADVNGTEEGGETSTPLMHINAHENTTELHSTDTKYTVGDITYRYPFSMDGTSTYFSAGYYTDNVLTVKVTNGTLRIGIKKDLAVENDWAIFDNFKLTYYLEDGAYFLRNRQTGQYLYTGNRYGTEATLAETGLDVTTSYEDGRYSINTGINNKYLRMTTDGNRSAFMDMDEKGLEVHNIEGKYFTISETGSGSYLTTRNGSTVIDFTADDSKQHSAHWQFLTLNDLKNELSSASSSNPMNATFFIRGYGFSKLDNRNWGDNGWKGSPAIGGENSKENGDKYCGDNKNATFDVYQNLGNLPNGTYILSAQAFSSEGTTSYLYADNSSVAVPLITVKGDPRPSDQAAAGNTFAEGWYHTNPVIVHVTDGNMRVGIKGNNNTWTAFDSFHLTYLGTQPISNPYTGATATYYIQNVATGEYLQGGDGWGARPTLGNGIEFGVEKVTDGVYNLYSGIKHTEGYLCDEGYIDHGRTNFIIQEVSSGIYTIATTTYHCNNLDKPANNGQMGRLLTVGGTSIGNIQFSEWSGTGAGATVIKTTADNFNNNIGNTNIVPGGIIFGDGDVRCEKYADITGYKTMRIKGTPGTYIQIRLNRRNNNSTYEGDTEQIEIGSDGWCTVDLTKYTTIHLNSIKHAWESPIAKTTIEAVILYKDNGSMASFIGGTNASAKEAQWRFVTEAQRIADLSTGSMDNPKEATFMVKGASFTRGDTRHENGGSNGDPAGKWTTTGHWFYVYRDDAAGSDGAAGIVKSDKDAEDVYQTITGLPNGIYEVSAQGCYRNFTNAVLYANNMSVAFDVAGSEFDACMNNNHASDCSCRRVASVQTYGTDKYKKTLRVKVTDGTLRLGIKGKKSDANNLFIFDNFRLVYHGEVEQTDYYIRNVATKEFVRAGLDYEAKLIRDKWGLQMLFTRNDIDKYSIDTKVSNGGENHYINTGGYADGAKTDFTLKQLANGYYTIGSGTSYMAANNANNLVDFVSDIDAANNSYAQWELLTREQLITELKNSGASDANPKDATFFIQSPNLGRHDQRTNTDNWKGIDFSSAEYGGYAINYEDFKNGDYKANLVIEKYNKNFDTYQTISGLPAGVYELTVKGFYRAGNLSESAASSLAGTDHLRPMVYAMQNGKMIGMAPLLSIYDIDATAKNSASGLSTSSNGKYVPNSLSDAAKAIRDGYYIESGEYNKVRFVVPADGATVQIGVKKNVLNENDWTVFDNFELTYLGAPKNGETQTTYDYEIGTVIGPVYVKNRDQQLYLTAGGSDGVTAVLGDKMYQHSVYETIDKYNKGVRETDFTFQVVGAGKMLVNTGIGNGYMTRDGGVKVDGKAESGNGYFELRKAADNHHYITYITTNTVTGAKETRFLRYSNADATDYEVNQAWNFRKTITTGDEFGTDNTNWEHTYNNGNRWTYKQAPNNSSLSLNGEEFKDTKGLLFKANKDNIAIYENNLLRINGTDNDIIIPNLKAGQVVTVKSKTANSDDNNRYLTATNLNVTSGFTPNPGNAEITNTGTVIADGDVKITTHGGLNIYSIEVSTSVSTRGIGLELSDAQTPSNNYQWLLQTKQDIIDSEFGTATADNPVDATFLLRGTAFHKDDSRNSDWKGVQTIGGAQNNYVANVNDRTFDVSQRITGVPNGVYEYTLQGYYITADGSINTNARYYVSTNGMSFIARNTNDMPSVINGKNYTSATQSTLVWQQDFTTGDIIPEKGKNYNVVISEKVYNAGTDIGTITINGIAINSNFGLQTGTTWLQRYTDKGQKGLYSNNSGYRSIGIANLKAGQIIRIKTSDTDAFSAANNVVQLDMTLANDGEVTFRVIKDGNGGISVKRYTYIYNVAVYNEVSSSTDVNISNIADAATLIANENGTHPVIRFKVENGTIILGAFNIMKAENTSLYMDNVRLTYLGPDATDYSTPIDIEQGLIHKYSRYYDLAEQDGNLTLNKKTYLASNNKTTMSDDAMVKHPYIDKWIQHTPQYEETIYAMAGQDLKIVMPNSYTSEAQSSAKFYQRFYNFQTDGLLTENAATNGTFSFNDNATVRKEMRVYEGVAAAPAGGWLFGNRWNNQMVSKFNFKTPTTFTDTIMIGVDHSDFTDIGDMGMFGNLTEPTLTQRLVYYIHPASEMVEKLSSCTGDKYLEVKSISFPTIWHGQNMNKADLNAVALDLQLKNYFTDATKVPVAKDFEITIDDGGTGITLATDSFKSNTDRFISFNYPDGGVVNNYKNTAYIYVKSNGKNIAKFILDFVPNTELRPWKDIMGRADMRRSPIYLEEHAILMEQMNFDRHYNSIKTDRSTWPVGDVTAINGIEEDRYVSSYDQFNHYPLNFDQTSFAAYYPNAIWGQYSVMKSVRIPSWTDVRSFKDINQLYHDHYTKEGNVIQTDKYKGNGYFMYIDASNFPSSVATLNIDEELCDGTTIHFSGWVSAMAASTSTSDAPGYLLFSIVGKKSDGTQETIESFCPGPIRADAMDYNGTRVTADTYNNELWGKDSRSIWQQFAFSFVIRPEMAAKYSSYALKIDNYCSKTTGGDMMVDDVRLYIQKAVPDIMQNVPVCNAGQLSSLEIYTTFEQLLDAVDKTEVTTNETDARASYERTSSGLWQIPQAWYCFLDKDVYDSKIKNGEGANAAFEAALVRKGGNDGGGYYKFDFSNYFPANNGGAESYLNNGWLNYINTAKGEIIYYQDGTTIAERRIYLNPPSQGLLASGEVSLKEMAYYYKSSADVELTSDMFHEWNGVGAGSTIKTETVVLDNNIGTEVGNYAMIYGWSNVNYLGYADLSAYTKMVIHGTPGMQLRVLLNRVAHEGALTEINPIISQYGTAEVYLSSYEYAHLNAIKTGGSSPGGRITKITLEKEWVTAKPDWNMDEPSATIYGSQHGEPIRYTDLAGYDELRIYQTEGNPMRCFFIKCDGSQITVSSTTEPDIVKRASDAEPWVVDLNALKTKYGQVKLIGIKAATSGEMAKASKITVYKSSGLEGEKDYYIVFRAYKGYNGEATKENPKDFFVLESAMCSSMAEFKLKSGTEVRFDGILNYEGGNVYCAGQVATMKVEMQGIGENNELIKQEDLFYDWWIGDAESFTTQQDGKPDSPKDVLYLFREEYPEATVYDGEPAKGAFTEACRTYLEELVTPQGNKPARLHLYQASLNARVDGGTKGEMTVIVVPIESQLKTLLGMEFCNEPMNLTIKVTGQGPTVSGGFEGTEYPSYIVEQPLRIGMKQIELITDDANNQWKAEDAAMYIPLRDLKASEGKYITFEKKIWTDGTTLDIAAVYLSETNDPDMISYEEVNGIKEMRFVGKIHKFKAAKDESKAFESYVQLTLNPEFKPKEGYRYTLKTSFIEIDDNNDMNTCHGDLIIPMYIVPEYQVWTGGADNNDWANNKNWRRADNNELDKDGEKYAASGRATNEQNTTSAGMVPMNFTKVLMPASDGSQYSYPVLNNVVITDGVVDFNGRTTQTNDIEYYLEADNSKPSVTSWVPRDIDLYCSQFRNNTCDEINFAPRSQMLNTQYLEYNKAWVEYELESERWYTLASPLKGVVSGDMYLPRNTAKQQTPYFTDIFYDNGDYSRLEPAVYQQSWDKAEATTYRLERDQMTSKLPPALEANTATVNVARAFNWSREYNDVKVPFGINGFSVKVDVSRIDGYSKGSGNDVLLRLPKNDKTYSYYMYDDATSGSQTIDLTTTEVNGKMLREGAGKLFTDDMKTSDNMTVRLTNNSSDNEYFLVGNPFMSALNLDEFFNNNPSLDRTYWILTKDSYISGVKSEGQHWLTSDGTNAGDIAPLQAFFVRKTDDTGGQLDVKFTKNMAVAASGTTLLTRGMNGDSASPALQITATRDGMTSNAIITCNEKASDGFRRDEDAEALFDSNLKDAPIIYTMAGDMATAVNQCCNLNGIPLGIESNDESMVTLTFNGVEMLGKDLFVYDIVEDFATPVISSGSSMAIKGKTSGRYYLVTSDISGSGFDSAPMIYVKGNTVSVVSMSADITSIEVNDIGGRRIYNASDTGRRHQFQLHSGTYIINIKTEKTQVTRKFFIR